MNSLDSKDGVSENSGDACIHDEDKGPELPTAAIISQKHKMLHNRATLTEHGEGLEDGDELVRRQDAKAEVADAWREGIEIGKGLATEMVLDLIDRRIEEVEEELEDSTGERSSKFWSGSQMMLEDLRSEVSNLETSCSRSSPEEKTASEIAESKQKTTEDGDRA